MMSPSEVSFCLNHHTKSSVVVAPGVTTLLENPSAMISSGFFDGEGNLHTITWELGFDSGRCIFSIFRWSENANLKNGSWYSFNWVCS